LVFVGRESDGKAKGKVDGKAEGKVENGFAHQSLNK
jgi:hypothetical protein